MDCTVQLKSEAAKNVMVSAHQPNITNSADFKTKGKANFVKEVTAAAGTTLYGDNKPIWTRLMRNITFRRGTMDCHEGKMMVDAMKINELWCKSGTGGVIFQEWARTAIFVNYTLPGETAIEAARGLAKKLGNLSFGVMVTNRSFAIRVKPEQYAQAKQAADPELAAVIGEAVMALPRGGDPI